MFFLCFLPSVGWLAGWLAGCLVSWPAGWLGDWLIGCLIGLLPWEAHELAHFSFPDSACKVPWLFLHTRKVFTNCLHVTANIDIEGILMEVELIEGQPTVTHPRSRLSRLGQVTLYELSSLFYGQPMQIPLQGEIPFFENHANNYVNLGNQTGKVCGIG